MSGSIVYKENDWGGIRHLAQVIKTTKKNAENSISENGERQIQKRLPEGFGMVVANSDNLKVAKSSLHAVRRRMVSIAHNRYREYKDV